MGMRKETSGAMEDICSVDNRKDGSSEDSKATGAAVVQEDGERGAYTSGNARSSCSSRSSRRRRRAADGEGTDEIKRCGMWLPSKRRFCASYALATSSFCGNHDPSAGEKRVPCPVDPSHTVLRHEVAVHVRKCQATKHMKFSEEQPYYRKGINAGSDGEEDRQASRDGHGADETKPHNPPLEPESPGETRPAIEIPPTDPPPQDGFVRTANSCDRNEQRVKFLSSVAKRSAITALSEREFLELVRRIESSHEASRSEAVEEWFLQPPQCLQWWDRNRDRRLPFQEKHVSQQASMLGNFEAFGLLKRDDNDDDATKLGGDRESRAFVEFGAGRGYLSQMLCDSYGVSSVVLVERKAYKYKADRTLRQLTGVSVERLRTDIEDLYLKGVEVLQGRRYVAVSKHLCGPATDLTLRCCLNEVSSSAAELTDQKGLDSSPVLEGVGIATCCHHLCQWRSYVNKQYFREIGFSEADFNMITWLTSWAVNESGEHAEVENPEAEKNPEQRVVKDGTSSGAEIAAPRLSEAMDAMDVGARAELGRKCKHLIDFGRLLFVRRHGMSAKIVKYISAAVSPENKLLLARRIFA
ncbi:hypothetical protein Mapa_010689 [Marchantia paleacea]|nr:hypothetical protein Mapa_010689 [Marchantia paleacea]